MQSVQQNSIETLQRYRWVTVHDFGGLLAVRWSPACDHHISQCNACWLFLGRKMLWRVSVAHHHALSKTADLINSL